MANFDRDLEIVRILRDRARENNDSNLALFASNFRLDGRKLRWAAWGDKVTDKTEQSPLALYKDLLSQQGSCSNVTLIDSINTPEVGSYEVYWCIPEPFRCRVYVQDYDSGEYLEQGSAENRATELVNAFQRSREAAEKIFERMRTGA